MFSLDYQKEELISRPNRVWLLSSLFCLTVGSSGYGSQIPKVEASDPVITETTELNRDWSIFTPEQNPLIVVGESRAGETERLDREEKQRLAEEAAKRRLIYKQSLATNIHLASVSSEIIWIGDSGPQYWSCVQCVERVTGINKQVGVARNWPITLGLGPTVGAVVILAEGGVGHVAEEIADDGDFIIIYECNYKFSTETKRRIRKDSPVIRGYFLP